MPIARKTLAAGVEIRARNSRQPISGQEVVACFEAMRLSNRQVAAMLDCSEGTVRQWISEVAAPPEQVRLWMRGCARAHLEAETSNPAPNFYRIAGAA